jgi:hypothetical protein
MSLVLDRILPAMVIRRWPHRVARPVADRLSGGVQITLFCINAANLIDALCSVSIGGYFAALAIAVEYGV